MEFVQLVAFLVNRWKDEVMRYCRVIGMAIVALWLITGLVSAQTTADKQTQAYIDMMRKDLRTQKQSIVDQAMGLDAEQKSQFWAIYKDYQAELDKHWDQRLANIKKYADNYDKMTDAIAEQLATTMLNLEEQRTALKKKYYTVFKQKMGPRVAARFLQVETTLAHLVDLQLGSEIPILE